MGSSQRRSMLKIPARYSHLVFGAMQSGVTCFVASGIASRALWSSDAFFQKWILSWMFSWLSILPVVFLVAPFLRDAVSWMTYDENHDNKG